MIFAATLMGVTFLTGLICLLDLTILKPRRGLGTKEGKIVEYAKSFFPVLLAVFIIRSFVIEPFKIPSGSMMPTLISGDFIAVNKFSYGLRLPVFNKTLIKVGEPKRGDVIVFHYPKDPNIDYIKRLIGLPGDEIRYDNKQLFINGEAITQEFTSDYIYPLSADQLMQAKEYKEFLMGAEHAMLIHDIPDRNYEFKVPLGHYLAMGDNRDNSSDGRVWGFVPDEYLVGKAFVIWLNFGVPSRIGEWIK